jgi:hypothetical protein
MVQSGEKMDRSVFVFVLFDTDRNEEGGLEKTELIQSPCYEHTIHVDDEFCISEVDEKKIGPRGTDLTGTAKSE